jgi:hypothetical protein
MIKFLHRSAINLPIIIIINWVICALILNGTYFYFSNFKVIDNVDTCVVCLSLLHFIIFDKYYSNQKKSFVLAILLSIILRLISYNLNENLYFYLYYSIILAPFIFNLWNPNVKK